MKWTKEQIEEYEKFYEKVKRRISIGESGTSAYFDKPEGYPGWAKQNFKETGGVSLPTIESIPMYEFWNCHKVYSGAKCPYCIAFKPK